MKFHKLRKEIWPCCVCCREELDFPRPTRSAENRKFARCPRLLDCLHGACEACLHDSLERKHDFFSCQVCEEKTSLETVKSIHALSYDWHVGAVASRVSEGWSRLSGALATLTRDIGEQMMLPLNVMGENVEKTRQCCHQR
jgi:hypothetical protein